MLQTASETRSETHGKFIWCELMTSDTEAAGRFYSSVLGWSLNAMPMGERATPTISFRSARATNAPVSVA